MITKNFSWEEMQASATAKRKGIDNTIPDKYRGNMEALCKEVLQVVRNKYKKPIVVSSGYRCPRLNSVVGGVKGSQHMTAAAADIHSVSDRLADNKKLWDVVMALVKTGEITCRQIIWEYGKRSVGPSWIHLSVNDKEHTPRKNQVLFVL